MTTERSKPSFDHSSLMTIRKGMLWLGVIGTFLIGIRHLFPGEAASGGAFDAFCPFGAIETLYSYLVRGETLKTTNMLNFAVLSGVIAVSLVAGRAFCGWICPLGAVQEGLARLARRISGEKRHVRGKASKALLPIHLPAWADRSFRYAKYLVLALVIFASITAIYPPLQPFCPARAVFSFQLTSGLMVSVLVVFLGTSLLVERFWCKYLCPLGGALAIFNKISPVRLKADLKGCTHCGRCDVECPMGIQAVPENLSDPECIRCLECLETCAKEDVIRLQVG